MGRLWAAAAATAMLFNGGPTAAQNCLGRADFDACMGSVLAAQQARTAVAQQQIWSRYLQTYGPWLRRQYSAYRGAMSFDQFAYWNLMTANGANIAGAQRAQEDAFRGGQQAQATVEQGNADYRAGMYANSAATSRQAETYSQGAIRGNTAQVDPRTGQVLWLPYGQPYNQPFQSGGQTYVQDEGGYYQWTGSSWARLQPRP